MKLRLAVLLFGLVAMFAPILPNRAYADEGAELRAFMGSSYFAGMIHQGLAALPPDVFRQCPGLVSNGSQVTILRPVAFEPNGFPASGLWRQSFPVSGCGNDTIVNFYFLALPGQKMNMLIGIPGSTIADLVLQRDAKKFAIISAHLASRTCLSFDVINTRFEGFEQSAPGSSPASRPWRETWTLLGCGRRYDVPIDFTPDKTGTQVTVPPGTTSDR